MHPGRRFAEFELLERLGGGAFGEVWRARDDRGRCVALKLLHGRAAQDAESLRRFEREARAATALDHGNLVRAFAAGVAEGRPYLVSELVEGGSLQALLDVEPRLDARRVVRLMRDLLHGLAAMHGAGLVHRDLKPANVLLTRDGTAKIADLGLTRPTDVARTMLTAEGEVVGTPAYMAPEQISDGGEVDVRADLHALGAIVFRALSGRLPFEAPTALAMMRAKLTSEAPSLEREVGVPLELARFVARLLARRPEDRPRTPEQALEQLARFAPVTDVGAAPATTLVSTLADAERADPTNRATSHGAGHGGLHEPGATLADSALAPTLPLEALHVARAACVRQASELLTLLSATSVVLGRDAAEGDARRVCLRVLPAAEGAERSLRISGRHCELALERVPGGAPDVPPGEARFFVRDLGSTHGTELDGVRLAPHTSVEVRDGARLVLAGVLELVARRIPGVAGAPPSLLLTRPSNGSHQRYLLVGGPVAFDLTARPLAPGRGDAILDVQGGRFQWRPAASSAGVPRPLLDEARPADPKT